MNKLAEGEGSSVGADLSTYGRLRPRRIFFPGPRRTALSDFLSIRGGWIMGAATLLYTQIGSPHWNLLPALGWMMMSVFLAATKARQKDSKWMNFESNANRVFLVRTSCPLRASRTFCEIHPDSPR